MVLPGPAFRFKLAEASGKLQREMSKCPHARTHTQTHTLSTNEISLIYLHILTRVLLEKFKCTLKEMNKRFKPMYVCLQGEEKSTWGFKKNCSHFQKCCFSTWQAGRCKQICKSIKCLSKRRWGVTEKRMVRQRECQCWLADRQDDGDVDVFIGLSAQSTGPPLQS